jgi:hypothetical protein
MHWNAQGNPQIPPDAKTKVQHNLPQHAFDGNSLGPPEHEK